MRRTGVNDRFPWKAIVPKQDIWSEYGAYGDMVMGLPGLFSGSKSMTVPADYSIGPLNLDLLH